MIAVKVKKQMHSQNGDCDLDVDIRFAENSCTAIYGESGVGKTTLLRMIAGLTMPEAGRIEVSGNVYFDSQKKINLPVQKRNIGFVFQDYSLFPNMTVEKNILFALKSKNDLNESLPYINQLISIMELENLKKKYPHEISGGQKQRVALARALVLKPKILLLDEPLSALDNAMRTKLQEHLKELMATFSFTTILVSHDLFEVKNLAQTLIILKDGQVSSIQHNGEFTI